MPCLDIESALLYISDAALCFPLQVRAAVRVRPWEPAGPVAVELRHGAAVSHCPGTQPVQHQQGGEQDGNSARR